MKKNHSKRITWVISIIADHLEMASNKEGRVGEVVAVDATSVLSDLFCGGNCLPLLLRTSTTPTTAMDPTAFTVEDPRSLAGPELPAPQRVLVAFSTELVNTYAAEKSLEREMLLLSP